MPHRDLYPEQYAHPLVGKRVRVADSTVEGVVERVVESRYGPLVILHAYPPDLAWSITKITVIEE